MAATALCKEEAFEQSSPSRAQVLMRYRHLRKISQEHLANAVKLLSGTAILQQAKRLGLAFGRTIVLDNEDDITLAYDLLIHTAPAGRWRAIDRYAAAAKLQQGTDKALMLEAMRNARFVIFRVKQRHPSTGLIVEDFFRGAELWLVDEGLEKTLPNESLFATRVYKPDQFVMTAGIGIPFNRDLLEDAVCSVPQVTHKMPRGNRRSPVRGSDIPYRPCGPYHGEHCLPRPVRQRQDAHSPLIFASRMMRPYSSFCLLIWVAKSSRQVPTG
jgi:hypothetical protein